MCLAIPYKVLEVKGKSWAEIEMGGTRHKVSLVLLPELKAGDWVLVNLGTAIAKIDEDEAREILNIYREMAEAEIDQNGCESFDNIKSKEKVTG